MDFLKVFLATTQTEVLFNALSNCMKSFRQQGFLKQLLTNKLCIYLNHFHRSRSSLLKVHKALQSQEL